ncbi:MAG: acetyltransferase, partial [uncultured bacterium]
VSLAIIATTTAAARVRTLPLASWVTVLIGGITYPLYLLHQTIGYIAFMHFSRFVAPDLLFAVIVIAIIGVSWAIWRFVDRPGQRTTKTILTKIAEGMAGKISQHARPSSY